MSPWSAHIAQHAPPRPASPHGRPKTSGTGPALTHRTRHAPSDPISSLASPTHRYPSHAAVASPPDLGPGTYSATRHPPPANASSRLWVCSSAPPASLAQCLLSRPDP
ncbi:hypothetical protein AcW1_002262 [Taiwanofungus camphoratus]|nr:hypothetical protein AcW1_002262 [Antrodia cinnamomea]